MRLAEILGSLHFLRNLCGEKGDQWRGEMEKLLQSENPDPERRARFIASFNRGYRSFGGTYTQCTASATEAIGRYMKEGETLSPRHRLALRKLMPRSDAVRSAARRVVVAPVRSVCTSATGLNQTLTGAAAINSKLKVLRAAGTANRTKFDPP